MVELWKPVVGFEGLYEVSSRGRVRSLDKSVKARNGHTAIRKGKVLRPYLSNVGRQRVRLYKDGYPTSKNHLIHRLVASAFIKNPENKPTVNHKDGDKNNNHLENIEWATWSENNSHAHLIGLHNQKGSNNNGSKLKEEEVEVILNLIHKGMSYKGIAEFYSVSPTTISAIAKGKTWRHIRRISDES